MSQSIMSLSLTDEQRAALDAAAAAAGEDPESYLLGALDLRIRIVGDDELLGRERRWSR